MPQIFISYCRRNSIEAGALAAALGAEGLDVWLDRSAIEDAASIQQRIDQGLAQSHALLAWYSLDYPQSRACQWELTAALIAASWDAAPNHRMLIVNPEAMTEHIQPVQARDVQHFPFVSKAPDHYATLARRVKTAVSGINGTLGALRRLTRPQWHGYHGLGSNRFVGRVVDLWAVHSALAASRHAIVAGLPSPRAAGQLTQLRGSGGIGKSMLAEEYALRFGAWWPGGVFWLRAYGNSDNPVEALDALAARRDAAYGSQLASCARELGLDTRDRSDAELHADLGRYLHHQDLPYLWVVDDLPACGRNELERWLAPATIGQTLLTTRSRRLRGLGAEIDLAILPPADARSLLTREHVPKPAEAADVHRLLNLLGGHALALDVARAACRRQGYAVFRERLEHPDRDALELAADLTGDLPNAHKPQIAATLLASIGQLNEAGLDCLRLAAQLASASIPRNLIAACFGEADSLDDLDAGDRADRGLQQLLDHSLADEAEGPRHYSVHTLVTRSIRLHDPQRQRQGVLRQAALAVLEAWMPAAANVHQHARLRPVLAHVQALARDSTDPSGVSLADWLGRYEFELGRYRAAQAWYEAAYRGRQELLGEEHPLTLASKSSWAEMLRAQGDLPRARGIQEEVLAVSLEGLGGSHSQTLTSLDNLAETLRAQGHLVDARALHERALEGRRQELGEKHSDTLTSMSKLASTLWDQGERVGARALQEAVLNGFRLVLGEKDPYTITSMNNLARMLLRQGDLERARKLLDTVVKADKQVLGVDHPNTLTSMNNLAEARRAQGDLIGARKLQEAVLKKRRRLLGKEHFATLISMDDLAETLRDQGDLARARGLVEEVLKVRQRLFGEQHAGTLRAMNNLAVILWQIGEQPDALQWMEAAAKGRAQTLGGQHPDTQDSERVVRQMRTDLKQIG